MVQQLQLKLMGKDKRWNRVLISYRNQQRVFPKEGIPNLIRYHHQLSWKPWILRDQYSCLRVFWFCLSRGQRFLYRWCSVLLRSCWRHLLYQRSIILGGIIVCRFRFWLHQWRLVQDQGRHILGRVYQLRSLRRMCWMRHLLLQLFCLMAFIHLARFHAQGRRVPSRRYLLKYQLVRRELK